MELEEILARTAERIVEHGTHTETRVLEAVSAATRDVCPGAAAALVDWDGSEITRLRAFGIVHGAVLGVLGRRERSWLLEEILGVAEVALAG
jgi:hypothetical protein